jgi:hypothetical protein
MTTPPDRFAPPNAELQFSQAVGATPDLAAWVVGGLTLLAALTLGWLVGFVESLVGSTATTGHGWVGFVSAMAVGMYLGQRTGRMQPRASRAWAVGWYTLASLGLTALSLVLFADIDPETGAALSASPTAWAIAGASVLLSMPVAYFSLWIGERNGVRAQERAGARRR